MYKKVICTILKTLAIKEKESFKGDHITQEQATQEQSEIEKLEKLANANSKKLKEMEKRSKLLSNKNDELQQQIDDLINKKKVIFFCNAKILYHDNL